MMNDILPGGSRPLISDVRQKRVTPSCVNAARERVAEFWDDHVARWLAGEDLLDDGLSDWLASYDGRGEGAVDRDGMVEPFTGDLLGVVKTPRVVVLGLNPGRYYPSSSRGRVYSPMRSVSMGAIAGG